MELKVICSWCKKVMREGDAPADAPVSSDCCIPCLEKHFPLICDDVKGFLKEGK